MKLPHHNRYDFSSIEKRKDYSWPGGKRLAFYVAVNIEHFAFNTGIGMDPSVPNAAGSTRNYAWRDYGNRVGIWRVFRMLDQLGLKSTTLLNSTVAELYPEIVARLKERGDDIVGHGRSNAEVHRGMWESDEARAIAEISAAIAKAFGKPPTGWMGPGASENNITPDLLKEAGYTHLLDWPMDDQPIWMKTRSGPLLSVPYPFEQNDAGHQIWRHHSAREFADMIVDQFDEMIEQCEEQPLVFPLSLHGFIVGQPFRLRPLRQALEHCVKHPKRDRVWFTRAGDIAEYCIKLPAGTIPGG